MATILFIILGLCIGSFTLATAWRIKHKRDFVRGTSECEACHHKLAAVDLIPVLSFISTGGKCRYCGVKLSALLPFAEVTGALVFGLSYYFWPYNLVSLGNWSVFILWLLACVFLLVLFFYDLQWFILPNTVMYPLWVVSLLFAAARLTVYSAPSILSLAAAVGVGAGIFWCIYTVSRGAWIGYGDVRLGVVIGLLTGDPIKAMMVVFVASILGCIVALPGLLQGKKSLASKLPFGPLLITGVWLIVIWGQQIITWYTDTLLRL